MDPVPPDAVTLRPMAREDIPALARLAREQGRNLVAADYGRFLALEGARGLVVERNGDLLGAATAMRYFEHAFLGPVVLGASEDATGIAIALLAQLIERMQRDGVDLLEAEAATVEEVILQRMGFVVQRRTVVLERSPGGVADAAGSVRMEPHHLLDVGVMDAEVAGYGRKEYLQALREELPEGARVVERDGDVVGYSLLRAGARGYHLGPVVTRVDDTQTAIALLRDALTAAAGAHVVALVPAESAILPHLAREGFREVGALARMSAGTRAPPATRPGARATQWTLGGRITG